MSTELLQTTADQNATEIVVHFLNTYWPVLSLFIILAFSTVFTMLWIQRFKISKANIPQNQRQNLENIYNRIHNFQYEKTAKSNSPTQAHQNNASTNSSYHHAIKLLQRGIDPKTLVEYCNLTYDEAELLQAVYGTASPSTGNPA